MVFAMNIKTHLNTALYQITAVCFEHEQELVIAELQLVIKPVQSVVKWEAETDGGQTTAEDRRGEEWDEVSVVEMSDTGVDPGTVMVHLHHTPGAPPAVMRPRGLVALTWGQF